MLTLTSMLWLILTTNIDYKESGVHRDGETLYKSVLMPRLEIYNKFTVHKLILCVNEFCTIIQRVTLMT